MNINTLVSDTQKYVLKTYNRFPITFVSGNGAELKDSRGKKYIDLLAGIAVNQLGYNHPDMRNAMRKIADKPWHSSNFFHIHEQTELAKLISAESFTGKTFFCSTGTEANEAAIKLALKYGASFPEKKDEFIAFSGSFHGRSLAPLSLTSNEKYRKDFPAPLKVSFADFNSIESVEQALTPKTAAVIIELIQGESGVNAADLDFYRKLRKLCSKNKTLLIVDEVQTGVGRTGKMFAYQNYKDDPDVITMAKGLGGGCPIGAMHTKDVYASYLQPGDHASTFGGNHLACAMGLALMKKLRGAFFLTDVRSKSKLFIKELEHLQKVFPTVKSVRGMGLMLAVELSVSANLVRDRLLEEGFIVNSIDDKIIRLLPPLVISKGDIKKFIKGFKKVLAQL